MLFAATSDLVRCIVYQISQQLQIKFLLREEKGVALTVRYTPDELSCDEGRSG
jgi:hypothetical protein